MTKLTVKDSGTWREIREVYVKNAGSWQQIDSVHVKDSGTWQKVFQAGWIIGAAADQSTIYEFTTELRQAYGNAVLSAGPLVGSRAEGTTGTWEVILAPGYKLVGDNGSDPASDTINSGTYVYESKYSVRYLFTAAADGSATLDSASIVSQILGGNSSLSNYTAGSTRVSVVETTINEAHFPHVVEWGNYDSSARTGTFTWVIPTGASSIQVSGIGGGGGGAAGGRAGKGNSATGGGGGGGGAYALNTATTASTFRITLGEGGSRSTTSGVFNTDMGVRSASASAGGTTTVLADGSAFLSLAGGGGGIGGQNWSYVNQGVYATLSNSPSGGNNGGSGGGSNGASGGKGSDFSFAFNTVHSENRFIAAYGSNYPRWDGFSGSSLSALGTSGGSGSGGSGTGYFIVREDDNSIFDSFTYGDGGYGGGGGGGGAGFYNGGNGSGGVGYLGSGGGGGRGEGNGGNGGDGYVKFTWTNA